ncbi:MAG: hypothetical protein OEY14_07315 [Myxococcales bacterium]|nr:hypothetical protein [Myxococcales bacterium]
MTLAASLSMGGQCGLQSGDRELGAACTRARECAVGLVCEGGVCSEPVSDGGSSVSDASDAAPLDGTSG